MKSILFQIKSTFSFESAMQEVKKLGLQDIFIIEDKITEDQWIGGLIEIVPEENTLISLYLHGPNEICWKEQWETFAENFQNGLAHIDLSRFGYNKTLYLLPGEGFGDLSHVTTYLMLDLMKGKVQDNHIVDIGSGSGILSLSAYLMNAKSAYGIEIDHQALRHAEKNALKNQINVSFTMHPDKKKIKKNSLFLMNMTFAEQIKFMSGNISLNSYASYWITSGILKEQKNKYLKQTQEWGWSLSETKSKDDWLGFIFSTQFSSLIHKNHSLKSK
jgi:ribosomal protein L11 methyltransferase